MDRKYQIFISSTYEDLKEERKKVQEAILSMYHIPIGMEMFSASDEEQWEIIKGTISSSDYYVLIVAHRYGSIIDSGSDAGISYTEKEYQYARSKGIPIIAFLIDEKVPVNSDFIDKETNKRRKLKRFNDDIKKGRMVEWWKNADDLAHKLTLALYKQFERNKRPGWTRSNANFLGQSDYFLPEIYTKYGVPKGKTWSVPMYAQEDQDTYHFIGKAKEIVFCARTGKGFLNGHYNLLKEFVGAGGTFTFVTSDQNNLIFDDNGEHEDNRNNSLNFLKTLYSINPSNVHCVKVDKSINLTLLYVKTENEDEFIEVKFVFQTELKKRHPIFRIAKESPFFDNFYSEIKNLSNSENEIKLSDC